MSVYTQQAITGVLGDLIKGNDILIVDTAKQNQDQGQGNFRVTFHRESIAKYDSVKQLQLLAEASKKLEAAGYKNLDYRAAYKDQTGNLRTWPTIWVNRQARVQAGDVGKAVDAAMAPMKEEMGALKNLLTLALGKMGVEIPTIITPVQTPVETVQSTESDSGAPEGEAGVAAEPEF